MTKKTTNTMDDKVLNEMIEKAQQMGMNNQTTNNESQPNIGSDTAKEILNDIALDKKYGDSTASASALGAARGLSFGISDQLLTKTGLLSKEDLRELKNRNKTASLLGEIGGVVAPTILSGGTSLLGTAARGATTGIRAVEALGAGATKIAEAGFKAALAREGKKSIAREIVKKSIPSVIGSAVEGSAYGLGSLISENALGQADISAENVIASIGTGALMGAVTKGIFETPKALAPIVKNGKTSLQTVAKKYTDPFEALMDFAKVNPKKAARIKEQNPKMVEELPKWFAKKTELKAFSKDETLEIAVKNIKNDASGKIGNIIEKGDTELANMVDPTIGIKVYKNIEDTINKLLDEKMIKSHGTSKIKKIKATIRSLIEESVPNKKTVSKLVMDPTTKLLKNVDVEIAEGLFKPVSLKGLQKLKGEATELIDFAADTVTSENAKIRQIRREIDDAIKQTLEKADTNNKGLLNDYIEANKDYSYASTLLPGMANKALDKKAKSELLNLTEFVLGGATVAALGGTIGTGVIALKKFAESDVRRKLAIMSSIEKTNKQVDSKINTSIKDFFKSTKFGTRTALLNTLTNSSYSKSEDKKEPKNKKEAFQNAANRITMLISDPEKLQNEVARRTIHLQESVPNIANYAIQTSLTGLQFLNSKLPKQATSDLSASQFTKRKFEPSQLQISKFERYLEAVENPMSALEDLKSGTLTREAAEAISAVYPKIFSKMQETVINELETSKDPVSYSKRLQLGILLNIETDTSLKNANIAAFQSNLAPKDEQSQAPTASKAENLNMAERQETKQNRISQR